MANIFVNIPTVGDAVVGYVEGGKNKIGYIAAETVDLTDMDNKGYVPLGVVYRVRNRKVGVVWKGGNIGSFVWSKKACVVLSGYTLDGNAHEAGYSTYPAGSDKTATTGTISYSATTLEGLAASLNTAFKADAALNTQNLFAFIGKDGSTDAVFVTFDINNSKQYWNYSVFTSGITNKMTSIPGDTQYGSRARTKLGHGGSFYPVNSSESAIYHYGKELTNENSWENYKPSKALTSLTSGYQGPFTIAQYKGENCQILRDYFETTEEGKANGTEEGFERFIRSIQTVRPSDFGAGTEALSGKEITQQLIKVGNDMAAIGEVQTLAHRYPAAYSTQGIYNNAASCADFLPIEEWYLPTIGDIFDLMYVVKYGVDKGGKSTARTADPVNATLSKLSGGSINNRSFLWSCVRNAYSVAWYRSSYGFAYALYVIHGNDVAPLSLLKLA